MRRPGPRSGGTSSDAWASPASWDRGSPVFGRSPEATEGGASTPSLNSLPGEAISKGLEALADGGRFVEIGKRDIHGNRRLGLLPFRNNLSFQAVDLDKIIREGRRGRQDHAIAAGEDPAGRLFCPFRRRPLALADDAFRSMASARHVGKLGHHRRRPRRAGLVANAAARISRRRRVLVTGGFGGFGLRIARWLADGEPRSIALMGRSGPRSDEARQTLAALAASGVRVAALECDVSRGETSPPLSTGCAASSGRSAECSTPPWSSTMDFWSTSTGRGCGACSAPRSTGAWNLHLQTRRPPRCLRAFLVGLLAHRQPGPGELRGGQRLPGSSPTTDAASACRR